MFAVPKEIAMFYLSINHTKKVITLFITLSIAVGTWSQSNGVAEAASEYVNMYTGDFNHSIPIVVVPGPNGESFPLVASYNAGIGMDQMSSWLGLGWSLNGGEISRKVNGVPDDWNGVALEKRIGTGSPNTTETIYGPLYFDNCTTGSATSNEIGVSGTKTMDIYFSNYKLQGGTGSPFMFPDYDQYSFNGGGIEGIMQPHIFKYGNIFSGEVDNVIDYPMGNAPGQLNGFYNSYGKVFFRMKNENTRIYAPVYSNANVLSNIDPGEPTSLGFVDSPGDMTADYFSNYDTDNTKLWSAYDIQYVTNGEINSNACTLQSQGFINLKPFGSTASCSTAYRSTTTFPTDGIGAYKVVAPNGFTYHYTLPVYSYDETIRVFDINTSYDVKSGGSSVEYKRDNRYATAWKLTAITGPDYVDANNNGLTDEGDTGYWIALEYGLWADNYHVQYPYAEYSHDITSSKMFDPEDTYWKDNPTKYTGKGTIIKGKCEIYYLNKVKTATHTAFFVKDIKLDDYDEHLESSITKKTPTLKLSKVVLLTNKDVTDNSIFSSTSSLSFPSGFSSTVCYPNNVLHVGTYSSYETTIKSKALQIVEFNQNYELCPKYVRNLNCTHTPASTVNTNGVEYKKFGTISYTSNIKATGKLTLNSISFHQENYDHLYGDYIFTYGTGAKNPDYHPLKKDFWGMYKSDFDATKRGNYTTPGTTGSYSNTDAWSMIQVKNPLGSTINVEYESDEYEWVGDHYSLQSSGLKKPTRLFMINSITLSSGTNFGGSMAMSLYDKDAIPFLGLAATDYERKTVAFRFTGTAVSCSTSTDYADCYTTGGPLPEYLPGRLYYNQAAGITVPNSSLQCTLSGTSNLTVGCSNYSSGCTWTDPEYQDDGFSSAGYIKLDMKKVYGGGIRVKSITTTDPFTATSYKMKYTYERGICTNDPDRFGPEKWRGILLANTYNKDKHAPSPNVGYSYVTAEAEGAAGINSNKNGKVKYEFQNYQQNNIGNVYYYLDNDCAGTAPIEPSIYGVIKVGEHNYVMGAVLKQQVYDTKNNLVMLVENEYKKMNDILNDDDDQFNTGRVDEIFYNSYNTGQVINFGSTCSGIPQINMVYYKVQYNYAIAKTTTVIDGMTVETEYRHRDPLTGSPILVITKDPTYGTRTSMNTMAWEQYPTLGPKTINSSNVNIITPIHTSKTYNGLKLVDDGHGLIEGAKTEFSAFTGVNKYLTWSSSNGRYELSTNPNTFSIWGNEKGYVYKATMLDNGLFANSGVTWKQLDETTIRNKKNQTLEARVLDTRYSCVKMGYNDKYPIAEIADANYFSFAFGGFESTYEPVGGTTHFDGEIQKNGITQNSTYKHTGLYGAAVTASTLIYKAAICTTGNNGIIIQNDGGTDNGSRTFRFSVWSYTSNSSTTGLEITVNGTSHTITNANADYTIGNWKRLTKDVTITNAANGTNLEVRLIPGSSSTAYFDDFRFHPIDAPMLSYVYDDKTGRVTYMLDAENLYSKYEYDNAGRVINTFVETPPDGSYSGGEKKVSTNVYHIHQ